MNNKSNILTLALPPFIMGAFTFFFRWLQNTNSFESDTGLNIPSVWNLLVALLLAASAVVIAFTVWRSVSGLELKSDQSAIRGNTSFYALPIYLSCLLFLVGGVMVFVSAYGTDTPLLLRIVGFSSVVSAAALFFSSILESTRSSEYIRCICSVFIIAVFAVSVIALYKTNSVNPVRWSYAIELVAACVNLLAAYYAAGFSFGSTKPAKLALTSSLSAYLTMTLLPDSIPLGMKLIFLASSVMFIAFTMQLIRSSEHKHAE